jgi:hypothetical protein
MPEQKLAPAVQPSDPAVYADEVQIGFNDRQFLLAFRQRVPDTETSILLCRIVLAPKTAGELAGLLAGGITKFQKNFGQEIVPAGITIDVVVEKKQAAQG